MYTYYLTQRPAMPGALPRDGLFEITALDPADIIPSIGRGAYDAATYTRRLTDEEIRGYELTPAQ